MAITIKWLGKTYKGNTYSDIMGDLERDPWFGNKNGLAKRVYKVYGIDLDLSSNEVMFKQLAKIGELSIIDVK